MNDIADTLRILCRMLDSQMNKGICGSGVHAAVIFSYLLAAPGSPVSWVADVHDALVPYMMLLSERMAPE